MFNLSIFRLMLASLIVLSFGYTITEARAGAYQQLVDMNGGEDNINIPDPVPVCEGIPNPEYPGDPSKLLPCDYYEKNGNNIITPNENDVPVRPVINYNEPPPLPVMQIKNPNSGFIDSVKGFFDFFDIFSWFKPQQPITTTPKQVQNPRQTKPQTPPKTTLSEKELSMIDQKSEELFDKCFYALDGSNGETPEVACRETFRYYSDNRAALNQIANDDSYADGIIETLKEYGDTTPVTAPKVTKKIPVTTQTITDTTLIFDEANRLLNLCNAQVNASARMNVEIFGNGAVKDKNLIMKMVNQYEYQDKVCLKVSKYMKNNINVLDAGTPRGWASKDINVFISNYNAHINWYNYLNKDGDFSIIPGKFEI